MPLVKLFARKTLSKPINLTSIQSKLCKIWGTEPNTTKILLTKVDDWTDESFQEDVYVDIRAMGKADRTREMVLSGMERIHSAFREENLIANVRLETYDKERYFHLPRPTVSSPNSSSVSSSGNSQQQQSAVSK